MSCVGQNLVLSFNYTLQERQTNIKGSGGSPKSTKLLNIIKSTICLQKNMNLENQQSNLTEYSSSIG